MISSDKDRPIALYCADCDVEVDHYSNASHPGHLVASVAGTVGKCWLRFQRWLRDWEHKYSPSARLRKWVWTKKFFSDSEPWLLLRLAFLIFALQLSASHSFTLKLLASLLSVMLLFDVLVTHFAIAFVTRAPADPVRSVLLALFSFVHLAIGFSVLYLAIGASFQSANPINMFDALYFSWTVATTVGLDNVKPNEYLGKLIVMFELMASLLFLATILQIMVNWLGRAPAGPMQSHELRDPIGQKARLCDRIALANARRPVRP